MPHRSVGWIGSAIAECNASCAGQRSWAPKTVVEQLLPFVQLRPLAAQDNTVIIFCRVSASAISPKRDSLSLRKADQLKR